MTDNEEIVAVYVKWDSFWSLGYSRKIRVGGKAPGGIRVTSINVEESPLDKYGGFGIVVHGSRGLSGCALHFDKFDVNTIETKL